MQEEISLRRTGVDWSCGRLRPELCIYCKGSGTFQTNPSQLQAFVSPKAGDIQWLYPQSPWPLASPFGFAQWARHYASIPSLMNSLNMLVPTLTRLPF